MSNASHAPARRLPIIAAVIGGAIGLLAGALLDVIVGFTAVASTLANGTGETVPFLVTTTTSADIPDATATFGWGMAALPLLTIVAGVLLAVRMSALRRD